MRITAVKSLLHENVRESSVTPIVGGYVEPHQAPGVGVEIDFKAAARRPFAEAPPVQRRHHDGAVVDW
jgi:L-alanine-DL-glutamate epimerase-like enolase superfamily enzyme